MKKLIATAIATALAAAMSACGGGDDDRAIDAFESAATAGTANATATPQRMRALAVPAGADAQLNAERLMDYGEEHYKDLFPSAETTRSVGGWVYRYYPQTGVYLAVIDWRVYVLGGSIGPEVLDVGAVSDYITITSPTNQAPTVSLTLALLPAKPTQTLVLTATAADADGTVAKVEYFNGDTKLGETRAEPHELVLASLPAGLYELSARATDDGGATTTTVASLLRLDSDETAPPLSPITVATLAKCPTAYGVSAADTYACLVGGTPTGVVTGTSDRSCTMKVSDGGVVTVSVEGEPYAVSVRDLKAGERRFTKTAAALSFDYGPITPTGAAVRIRARSEDKVPGQFFQQGGSLVVEVMRAAPEPEISCTIPLALS